MKRLLALLSALALLICLIPFSAFAAGWGGFEYAVGPVNQKEGRVKLRKKASQTAEVLGQYFPGTPLEVISFSSDWAKVKIGDREGYMMRKFILHDSEWAGPGEEGEWGQIIAPREDGLVKVYSDLSNKTSAQTYLNYEDNILVLGTIDDDWLQVRVYKEEFGKAIYGYVSSLQIGKPDERESVWIDAGRADQTVNFREKPNKNAKVLGRYFSGVHAYSLYDNHVAEDGWQKVMIGDKVGYIMDDFLNAAMSGMRQPFRPPMTEINKTNIDIYGDETGKAKIGRLIQYDPFQVLGIYGKYYHIRIEGLYGEADRYGFIRISDVKKQVQRSAKTMAVTNRDTPCYWGTAVGELEEKRILPKGTKVTVYFAARDYNEGECDYLYPETLYLFVGAEFPEGGGIEAYVPIECIDYDVALEYPEIMTLG